MGPIKLSPGETVLLASFLILVLLVLSSSGGLIVWALSGRADAFWLGMACFAVATVWAKGRLGIDGGEAPRVGWGASAVVGVLLRLLPDTAFGIAATLVVVGAVVVVIDSWRRRQLLLRDAAFRSQRRLRS